MQSSALPTKLWQKIEAFEFDRQGSAFSFSNRLEAENGWSPAFTRQVISEYRRFLYLCVEAGHPVTPSDEIDQAWHLHLCYTRSYWEELCRDTLGRPIHHGPTQGGDAEARKFDDWYRRTLDSYATHFGEAPPPGIWPSPELRFAPRQYRRLDISRYCLVPRVGLRSGAAALAFLILFAGCEFVGDGGPDLKIVRIVFLVVIGVIIYKLIKRFRDGRRGSGRNGCGGGGCSGGDGGASDSDSGCSSGCGAGCGGD
jgi:hypothetical protein